MMKYFFCKYNLKFFFYIVVLDNLATFYKNKATIFW